MKRFVFLAITFLFFLSCVNITKTELTDEQKEAVTSEVKKQFNDNLSDLSKLDIDIWSEFWSKDDFVSASSGTNYFSTLEEFRDSVINWFSLRQSQKVEIIDVKIKVLTPELAILTSTVNWNVLFKSGEQFNSKSLVSLLWEKETNGWKSIFLHESF